MHSSVIGKTVSGEVSAITTKAILAGIDTPSPTSRLRLNYLLQGFDRIRQKGEGKAAFPAHYLRRYIFHLERQLPNRQAAFQRALLTIQFRALFRVGDYTARSSKIAPPLTMSNLKFSKKSHHFHLFQIKNKPNRSAPTRFPFLRLTRLPAPAESFLLQPNGSPTTVACATKVVKQAAQFNKLDPKDFATHSLRKGCATDYWLRGASQDIVEKLGRWAPGSKAMRTVYQDVKLLNLQNAFPVDHLAAAPAPTFHTDWTPGELQAQPPL